MKILFAGGGTAGHIEPALAVARAWRKSHPLDEIFFIGTTEGLENSLIPAAGFPLNHIPKVTISRSLSPSLLKVPIQLIQSISATRLLLREVDCAVGFGGYVSGPLYIAAAISRTPFVIHEQNARPGWANRLGARLTKYLAISYPVNNSEFKSAELTGLPLRNDVVNALSEASKDWAAARDEAKRLLCNRYGLDASRPLVFIFGGSQGSQAINSVINAGLPKLKELGISVIHGVGAKNELPASTESYKALAYIDEMAMHYLAADLLIARSGAVTCAEAQALARFSLFIPLPIGNGEQALNASSLVKVGRAEVIAQSQFTSGWLVGNIERLLNLSSEQSAEGDSSGAAAAAKIVKIIEKAAEKK